MKRTICLLLLLVASAAQASFFISYAEWASATDDFREAYITGAFDSLVTFAHGPHDEVGPKASVHYRQCLLRSNMTNTQLAENVLRYAQARPSLHAGSVQVALVQYLNDVCGAPKY